MYEYKSREGKRVYNLPKSNPKYFCTCTPQTITCDDFFRNFKNVLENNEEQNKDGQFNDAVDVDLDCDICHEVNIVIKGLQLNKLVVRMVL